MQRAISEAKSSRDWWEQARTALKRTVGLAARYRIRAGGSDDAGAEQRHMIGESHGVAVPGTVRGPWLEQAWSGLSGRSRSLSRRLVEVQEAERRRLAAELHDLVGQNLSALNINLNILRSLIPAPAIGEIGPRLEESLKLVDQTIDTIREVMSELRPAVLDDYGLMPALRWYAERFARRTGVQAAVEERGSGARLPAAVEEALFRIVQEALINVAKYAGVRQAAITVEWIEPGVRLTVADDGCGFDAAALEHGAGHRGWGLTLMAERAAAIDATLSVASAAGMGTRVVVEAGGAERGDHRVPR